MISPSKKQYILELKPSLVRVGRLTSVKAPCVVEEVIEIPLVETPHFADKLREFAAVKGNGYLAATCSIYPDSRVLHRLTLDVGKGKEEDFVLSTIKDELKLDPNELKAYCLSAETGEDGELSSFNKKNILISGANKGELRTIQDRLLSEGAFPGALEIGTLGVLGVVKDVLTWKENKYPLLFLEIEGSYTNAIIVGCNGVEMSRKIEFGSDDIVRSIKEQMSLKSEEAAEKLLSSNDFDFGEMSQALLRKLLRELQSSIGFYEVQTGQTVSHVLCLRNQGVVEWLQNSVCQMLNLEGFSFDIKAWLEAKDITATGAGLLGKADMSWLGFLAMLCDFDRDKEEKS
ncbi:hypothetical protein MLD52_02660 [Puniceicoccaceae bacterium K14]|nr:hypothetical protein [Puniceicoccaceae bacterium K14]